VRDPDLVRQYVVRRVLYLCVMVFIVLNSVVLFTTFNLRDDDAQGLGANVSAAPMERYGNYYAFVKFVEHGDG
jgi:hypothetical protein